MKHKTYQSYQNSSVEWIGNIPKHWQIAKLKTTISSFTMGSTPNTNNGEYWSNDPQEGIPWVLISDITASNIYLDTTEKYLSREGLISKNLEILEPNTVLFSIYASIGKVAILTMPAVTNQAIVGLKPNCNLITSEFLYYALTYSTTYLPYIYKSTTQKNLSLESIRDIPLPLPPVAEQEHITSFLHTKLKQIDEIIEKKKQMIELLKEKNERLILNTISKGLVSVRQMKPSNTNLGDIPEHWRVIKLKYLTKSIKSGDNPDFRVSKTDQVVPLYGANGIIGYTDKANINAPVIVVGRVGSAGKIHLISEPAWVSDNALIAEVFLDLVDLSFLYYQLVVANLSKMSSKSAQPLITASHLANCLVVLPPLEEQKEIARFLDKETAKNNSLIDKIEKSIARLEEYRYALISKAVTGKICLTPVLEL